MAKAVVVESYLTESRYSKVDYIGSDGYVGCREFADAAAELSGDNRLRSSEYYDWIEREVTLALAGIRAQPKYW